MQRLANCIDRGLEEVADAQQVLRSQVEEVKKIQKTLDPAQGSARNRRRRFQRLKNRLKRSPDPICRKMAVVMASFLVGLFAGGDLEDVPEDNLDLERWFRIPKGHERRIHGRRHAGIRLVIEGATLIPTLDAHHHLAGPLEPTDLLNYRDAQPPSDEQAALHRRKIRRNARSKKKRSQLLKDLESRYQASC